MKVITLNCFLSPWSPKARVRLPLIARALTDEKPDIVLLQEVADASAAEYLMQELSKQGLTYSFYSKTLLIISRYPFVSRGHYDFRIRFSLNPLLYINEILNRMYGKGFQVVEISVNDAPIMVINTHLISAYGFDHGVYGEARRRQFAEIAEKSEDAQRVILGGDFNFDIDSFSYDSVLSDYGFIDPLGTIKTSTVSSDNLNRKFFLMDKVNQRLDHIFIRGFEAKTMPGGVIFKEPYTVSGKSFHISDHYGLSLDIE